MPAAASAPSLPAAHNLEQFFSVILYLDIPTYVAKLAL
jgi:hypothetical protein